MHVEKFSKTAVGHMLHHFDRTSRDFGNEEIDRTRSALNYNLAPDRGISDILYYKERLAQVKCQNRADIKTLCDWIITLPKQTFSDVQEQQFFKVAYDFMTKKYKEMNVVSSWVHRDEGGQPHMHFCFIPVCLDKKRQFEKVSAKEVLTRNSLKSIHKDMSDCMKEAFGFDIGILTGSTVGGNKTVAELKTKAVQAELSVLAMAKKQSICELAEAIKKHPKVLKDITTAVNIATNKEAPTHKKFHEREARVR